jgi:hypothetical protein
MPVSAAPQRRIAAAPAQTQPAMPAPGGAPVAAEPAEDPAMQATRAAAELAADLARLQKVRDKAKPGARTALDATIKVVSGKLGAAELAAQRAEAERVAKAKQAEDAQKDEADTQGRLGQFAAGMGRLNDEQRARLAKPGMSARLRETQRSVELGEDPQQAVTALVAPTGEDKGREKIDTLESARESFFQQFGHRKYPRALMTQDEADEAYMGRLEARFALHQKAGMTRDAAAARARKENALEQEIDKARFRHDQKTGRRVTVPINWHLVVGPADVGILREMRARGELDSDVEMQFDAADAKGQLPGGVADAAPPASAPPASEPQAAGGVRAQVDAIMADGSLSVEEKRRRLEALRAGS